ncbi:CHAP domain-containing protein [Aeromicrobium sp. Root236]|uniref:CHAP domain-containing protein n=1 Tax=Aeromicrobium sp. Root236 TaxID=1736498 RepID=UPI0009EC6521|nr:CHAP domain-containing protein [Aeromicrobium sp. Root236]
MRHAHGPGRLLGVAVAMVMTLWAAPAQGLSLTVLCTGFTGCLTIGRTDGGYGAAYLQSFWSMTAGHNCTNYVAYRLTHGRLVARPPGTNSALTWGPAATQAGIPVDDVPTVGAIAWWDAGVDGASATSGHVAYVEAIVPGGVLVSEDNLSGDFRWRLMTRLDGTWPSGFIHYPASDGSPSGEFTSVSSPDVGTLDFWGSSMDPDGPAGNRTYLVSLGGPRGTPGAEVFTFESEFFRFHRISHVSTSGPTSMFLYALNAPGTAGGDALLGQRDVTIRATSVTRASFVDSSITRTQHPRVRISLAPTLASGTVDVMRGSTLVKRVTMISGSRLTVSLPRQRRGRWALSIRYRGTRTYEASSRTVYLRVR